MTPISDAPLAVLVARDGEEYVWALFSLPPPPELLIPRREPLSAKIGDGSMMPPEHRRFRLRPDLRSRAHRWWEVYNDGRSRTPQDGFVYLETPR